MLLIPLQEMFGFGHLLLWLNKFPSSFTERLTMSGLPFLWLRNERLAILTHTVSLIGTVFSGLLLRMVENLFSLID